MEIDPAQYQPDSRLWPRAKQWILDRTVAIYYRVEGGNANHHGSGLLVQLGEKAVFLVSASHVLEIVREKAELLIGTMTPGARGLISLGAATVMRTTDQEKLDVGVVRLHQNAIDALAQHKQFIQMRDLDLGRAMPQGRYYVVGYPIELTRTDHTTKQISIGYIAKATHLVDSDHAHPSISIALSHEKNSISFSNDGERARSPHLKGASGCGVWRLWANEEFERLNEWDESWIRLAAIEHRTAGEAIIGTMLAHVLDLILKTQPSQLTMSSDGVTLQLL
jgi:hypothetical protein